MGRERVGLKCSGSEKHVGGNATPTNPSPLSTECPKPHLV